MTRAKKIVLGVLVVIAILSAIPAAWLMSDWVIGNSASRAYGYTLAGIKPIPGARIVSKDYFDQSMRGGVTVWVYQIPTDYAKKLYRDCSVIGYKQGTFLDHGDVDDTYLGSYVKAGAIGCYNEKSMRKDIVIAQFIGDKLLVQDVY